MIHSRFNRLLLAAGLLLSTFGATAQDNIMVVDAGKKGIPVQETMYGLFFEDINLAADGGLYTEKVKNRSFEFDDPFMGWSIFGNANQIRSFRKYRL